MGVGPVCEADEGWKRLCLRRAAGTATAAAAAAAGRAAAAGGVRVQALQEDHEWNQRGPHGEAPLDHQILGG
eukprot:1156751-Pelagomonas_calceolata.AAC.6